MTFSGSPSSVVSRGTAPVEWVALGGIIGATVLARDRLTLPRDPLRRRRWGELELPEVDAVAALNQLLSPESNDPGAGRFDRST